MCVRGWGGGVKNSLLIAATVCGFRPGSSRAFLLYMDHQTHGGGSGSELQVTPPPF